MIRLTSSGRDPAEFSAQLALARDMRRGKLALTFRLRTAPATTGTLEVLSAYTRDTAMRLAFVPGGITLPGATTTQPLPPGEWIDAIVIVDLARGRWSARFRREDLAILEINDAPSPKTGLESVDWFGWTLDPRVASTLEISGISLRHTGG